MYNKSNIMKRAWEIKKQDKNNIWGLCLKMAWDEAKNIQDFHKYEEEFLPTRRQIGIIYRTYKVGIISVSKDRINEIYKAYDEFEINKMNYGFGYAKANAGVLLYASRAIHAILDKNYKAAEFILK